MRDNRLYWIWLQQALEPGGTKTALALSAFASPEAAYKASRSELMRAGFTGALLERLCRKSLDPAARILEDSLRDGAFVLTMDDEVDVLYEQIYRECITRQSGLRSQDSDVMTAVNVAQYIEHVGDHIVNWARWWLYFVGEQDSDIIV